MENPACRAGIWAKVVIVHNAARKTSKRFIRTYIILCKGAGPEGP